MSNIVKDNNPELFQGHSDRCTCGVCIATRNGAKTLVEALKGHSSGCTCSVCIRLRNRK